MRARSTTVAAGCGVRGLGAVVTSQLLLRIGSAAGALVVGSYFVELRSQGVPVTAFALGVLSGLTYVAELVFAPAAGASSDRRGRRVFLLVAPLFAAVGVLVTPTGSLVDAVPPLVLVFAVVAVARLVEGAGTAMAVPATLGLLADATDDDRLRRGRQMSFFELASAGGIAVGAAAGPVLWSVLGLWAFVAVAGTYLVAGALVAVFVREPRRAVRPARRPVRRWLAVLGDRRLVAFLPAWVAVNAILGTWVAPQITFVLTGDLDAPGQRFVGALAGHGAWLSVILGGYVLLFGLCVVAWAFLVGRLPTLPVLLVAVGGAVVASVGLMLANHGVSWWIAGPVVLAGMFLEAGFAPAALTYLAEVSGLFDGDRGMVMGVYSVVLGVGYLLGNVLGGAFAQWLAFDGLALLTILLAVVGAASVTVLIATTRRAQRSQRGT